MSDRPRRISIYMKDESHLMLERLCKQTGLSHSAMVRDLIEKAAGEEGSKTDQIREHVAALARLLL